jgi:hypothetical protein
MINDSSEALGIGGLRDKSLRVETEALEASPG